MPLSLSVSASASSIARAQRAQAREERKLALAAQSLALVTQSQSARQEQLRLAGLLPHRDDEASEITTLPPSSPPSSPRVSLASTSSTSSDEEESLIPLKQSLAIPEMSSNSTSSKARVQHTGGLKNPPIVTAGTLTAQVIKQFESAMGPWFNAKKIDEPDRTRHCFGNFECARVVAWMESEGYDELAKLSFPEFCNALRTEFLEHDWAITLRAKLVSTFQRDDEKWSDFYNRFSMINNVLKDSPDNRHLDFPRLVEYLVSNAVLTIRQLYIAEGVEKAITGTPDFVWDKASFKKWHATMLTLDRKREFFDSQVVESSKRIAEKMVTDAVQKAKRARTDSYTGSTKSSKPSNTNGSAPPSSNGRVPDLTPTQLELLKKHHGCFKCRLPYQDHGKLNCPNSFPDLATYRPPTEASCLAAKAGRERARAATTTASGSGLSAVAATFLDNLSAQMPAPVEYEDSSDDFASSGQIDELFEDDNQPVHDDDVSSDPSPSHHLLWRCLIDGQEDFPTSVLTMLDNGAHIVLIDSSLVDKLGLKRHPLRKPFPVSPAFSPEDSEQNLTHYARFTVSSTDNAWRSRVVQAVIVNRLCVPLLLGLPFLEKNGVVVDHRNRVAMTDSGYDLLHPASLPRPAVSKILSPIEKVRQAVVQKRDFVKSLKDHLLPLKVKTDMQSHSEFGHRQAKHIIAAIQRTSHRLSLQERADRVVSEFPSLFEPIPHASRLPTNIYAEINLKDASKTIETRTYPCPRKYREALSSLIDDNLNAGFIQPSSSPHASPAFIVLKADPKAKPRLVIDYRQLNENSVSDKMPLPRVDDILADCAKGKIFSCLDMTNSFFQTHMRPDHVPLTAFSTPSGLYEWLVMPMGFKNAPAIHQRRVSKCLERFIGKFCYVYLDDIIIFSQTLDEHEKHLRLIMSALRDDCLFLNRKKCLFFQESLRFLGHIISKDGIRPDGSKVDRIRNWPVPTSATDVRSFLGLVRYLGAFLPDLAKHTSVLNPLTHKECNKHFPPWSPEHHAAFEAIKDLVLSADCLTTIDHENPGENKIFVTTDASDTRMGAVLSFGPTWESARPVAFDSTPLHGAQLHYPVHEKELLAVVSALRKWRADLLGSSFFIYTDHKTLENFQKQRDFSRRQARWMEYMSQFEGRIVYVRGENNTVADALSRVPLTDSSLEAESVAKQVFDDDMADDCPWKAFPVCSLFSPRSLDDTVFGSVAALLGAADPIRQKALSFDETFIADLKKGYTVDPWCQRFQDAARGLSGFRQEDGLWFVKGRLVIPNYGTLRAQLYTLAHDYLGHLGFQKSYSALKGDYYWPNMRTDLEKSYLPGCEACQRNKDTTTRAPGPLHPLPVPDERCASIAMDFVGPLPMDNGYDCVLTITCRLGSDIQFVPCRMNTSAAELAELFFDRWYCENGMPTDIVSDRDKLFTSTFWKTLHALSGIKLKKSTAFHPQTDGSSERTNKTLAQMLRYHVDRRQRGWVKALPRVRFAIMNTVNASTGFTPFQLKYGRSPRVIPPIGDWERSGDVTLTPSLVALERLQNDVSQAQDSLLAAKINQAAAANKTRSDDPVFEAGEKVMLCTRHRRREYKQKGSRRVAKFMPRWDGPYLVLEANPDTSTYTIFLPEASNTDPTFHVSLLKRHVPNDASKFPHRERLRPGPVVTADGVEEWEVEKLLDFKRVGRGIKYYVRWAGYGPEVDSWEPASELEDCAALDEFLKVNEDARALVEGMARKR